MSEAPKITISVVSHDQADLIGTLLDSLQSLCRSSIEVLITSNLPETLPLSAEPGFLVKHFRNSRPKGFGDNHNAAFRHARGAYYCVINPDIRLTRDPFPELIALLEKHPRAGVVAPLVTTPSGELEDSARDFPTPWSIAKKFFGHNRDREFLRRALDADAISVDWVAGMFMLFPRDVFAGLGGFDKAYFLYYEDVDLCSRLQAQGREVLVSSGVSVIHDARRESHRNLKYLRWHLSSMLRFFLSHFIRRRRGIATL